MSKTRLKAVDYPDELVFCSLDSVQKLRRCLMTKYRSGFNLLYFSVVALGSQEADVNCMELTESRSAACRSGKCYTSTPGLIAGKYWHKTEWTCDVQRHSAQYMYRRWRALIDVPVGTNCRSLINELPGNYDQFKTMDKSHMYSGCSLYDLQALSPKVLLGILNLLSTVPGMVNYLSGTTRFFDSTIAVIDSALMNALQEIQIDDRTSFSEPIQNSTPWNDEMNQAFPPLTSLRWLYVAMYKLLNHEHTNENAEVISQLMTTFIETLEFRSKASGVDQNRLHTVLAHTVRLILAHPSEFSNLPKTAAVRSDPDRMRQITNRARWFASTDASTWGQTPGNFKFCDDPDTLAQCQDDAIECMTPTLEFYSDQLQTRIDQHKIVCPFDQYGAVAFDRLNKKALIDAAHKVVDRVALSPRLVSGCEGLFIPFYGENIRAVRYWPRMPSQCSATDLELFMKKFKIDYASLYTLVQIFQFFPEAVRPTFPFHQPADSAPAIREIQAAQRGHSFLPSFKWFKRLVSPSHGTRPESRNREGHIDFERILGCIHANKCAPQKFKHTLIYLIERFMSL